LSHLEQNAVGEREPLGETEGAISPSPRHRVRLAPGCVGRTLAVVSDNLEPGTHGDSSVEGSCPCLLGWIGRGTQLALVLY